MTLPLKSGRQQAQLPTLCYEVKLTLPTSVDSDPQEISFLDLITNDPQFKTDKEALELVLSSYVKACGKQSVTEILAERDPLADDDASLADVIRALMDHNDLQNANLGVGYADPDNDDSFIDDSTAAQDIIPRHMTNERNGFYVNEKHEPIKARYIGGDSEVDDDDDTDDDDSSDASGDSSESDQDDKQNKKSKVPDHDDSNEKKAKKNKPDDEILPEKLNPKRKRTPSEPGEISPMLAADEQQLKTSSNIKPAEATVKKVKKTSDSSETCSQILALSVLPPEMETDIGPSIDKLVKLLLHDQPIGGSAQKKIECLFDPLTSRELFEMAKKLHRHTNANRQLVFDLLGAKTGVFTPLLITRARTLLMNDYDKSLAAVPLSDLMQALKNEVSRSLELHVTAHNQAVKEWQQKMADNPSKDKIRGPRKNFRLHKTINELIIRCIDRKLETMTIVDSDGLEMFLHDSIVQLWERSGWMTAKKIISEVIKIEYRPLRDMPNVAGSMPIKVSPPAVITSAVKTTMNSQTLPSTRVTSAPVTAERITKEPLASVPSPKISKPRPSQPVTNVNKLPQQQNPMPTNDSKNKYLSNEDLSANIRSMTNGSSSSSSSKPLELATRITTASTGKQQTSAETTISQISEQTSTKSVKLEIVRPMPKPVALPPDSSSKRVQPVERSVPVSNPSSTVIDLTMDSLTPYKKPSNVTASNPILPLSSFSSTTTDPAYSSAVHRLSSSPTTASASSKQQQHFATKLPSERAPLVGSFLKEALLTGSSPPPPNTPSPPVKGSPSTKINASPLAVDNMLNKSTNSPKSSSSSSTTPIPKTSSSGQSQRASSGSSKSSSQRPSADYNFHRVDQPLHQQKSPSSNRHQTNGPNGSQSSSSSVSVSPSSRRPSSGIPSGFSSSHDPQTSRALPSQVSLPQTLSQSMQWDSAALQLAAALANPQLLNSSVFDPHLFNSVLAAAMNPASQSSSSSSQSRHQSSSNRRT